MNIQMVPATSVRPANWRTTYVLKPDLVLLTASLRDAGWLAPIVVRAEDSTIIDGFHRWIAAQDQKFLRKHGNLIPVVYVDVDEIDAMVMHVRLNRARGQIVAKKFAALIASIVRSGKYDSSEVGALFEMSDPEIDLMLDASLIKRRNIKEHNYSNAWIPVEAPPASELIKPTIERPVFPDR